MLGDTLGDLKAAENNGVWFFPIIPGKEVESWVKLKKDALKILLDGVFNQEYLKILIDNFYKAFCN